MSQYALLRCHGYHYLYLFIYIYFFTFLKVVTADLILIFHTYSWKIVKCKTFYRSKRFLKINILNTSDICKYKEWHIFVDIKVLITFFSFQKHYCISGKLLANPCIIVHIVYNRNKCFWELLFFCHTGIELCDVEGLSYYIMLLILPQLYPPLFPSVCCVMSANKNPRWFKVYKPSYWCLKVTVCWFTLLKG